MKNLTRSAFVLGVVASTSLSSAQLTMTGYGNQSFNLRVDQLSEVIDHTITVGGNAISVDVNDLHSYRVSRQFDDSKVSRFSYFSMKTGNVPMQLLNIQTYYQGKAVYAGATLEDIFLWVNRWEIVEVHDLNNNGFWDNEISWVLSTQDDSGGGRFDQGLVLIDEPGKEIIPDPILLGPNSVFALRLHEELFSFHDITIIDPNITMTAEWSNPPFAGTSIAFQFRPVPEPATLAVLGLGVLTLLRRRKKIV